MFLKIQVERIEVILLTKYSIDIWKVSSFLAVLKCQEILLFLF